MLLLFLTWKHDDCFISKLGQHLQFSKTPDLKLKDEDNTVLLNCTKANIMSPGQTVL